MLGTTCLHVIEFKRKFETNWSVVGSARTRRKRFPRTWLIDCTNPSNATVTDNNAQALDVCNAKFKAYQRRFLRIRLRVAASIVSFGGCFAAIFWTLSEALLSPAFFAAFIFAACISCMLPLIAYAICEYSYARLRPEVANSPSVLPIAPAPSTLRDYVTTIASQMQIPADSLSVAVLKFSDRRLPMVDVRRHSTLYLPLGFLPVRRSHRSIADALVAHELAHVLHGDSEARHRMELLLARNPKAYHFAIGALYLAAYLGREGIPLASLTVIILGYILDPVGLPEEIRSAVREGELLADLRAATLVSEEAMIGALEFIEENTAAAFMDEEHPEPRERILELRSAFCGIRKE
jgi:hypothetical protein